MQNAAGCDSVVSLHLTVRHSNSTFDVQSACDSLSWHGTTYFENTSTPTFTTFNSLGCDSTVTLLLTVNHGSYSTQSAQACDNFSWHGTDYDASGTYVHPYINDDGCFSVDTLLLDIHNSYDVTLFDTACDSYYWFDTLYTHSTTTPRHRSQTVFGCDSIVNLHLTIHYSVADTLSITATGSYQWNGQTYTQSGEYTYQGQTAYGCDSTVLLLLTIQQDIGIPSTEPLEQIAVYPNPTSGQITISAENVVRVEVYDYSGRLVADYPATNRIDLSRLPAGDYVLRISVPQGSTVRKVIKR